MTTNKAILEELKLLRKEMKEFRSIQPIIITQPCIHTHPNQLNPIQPFWGQFTTIGGGAGIK